MTVGPSGTTGASSGRSSTWQSLPWDRLRTSVKRLQMRIAQAVRANHHGRAQALQWLLTHSRSAKLLAVRRVTSNKGHTTPGVDGQVWRTERQKLEAADRLHTRGYQPQPLRRLYIPKKNGKLRPLSIPTMLDRAQQALHALALQPVAETKADKNSYGFREGRSCADAMGQCFIALAKRYAPVWVLEGDIAGCFDHISHDWLLDHIPMHRPTLRKWLRAGYLENGRWYPTEAGTPQGGIASPLLANLTLDQMEPTIRAAIRPRRDKVNFIRYADDFVVTAARKETLEETVKPVIAAFLRERGLRLSEEKTKITHIEEGFDFLGQNLRKRGRKLRITPSRQAVAGIREKARQCIRRCRGLKTEVLIRTLNPLLRGWANYHRYSVAREAFHQVNRYVNDLLWRWARRRHPNHSCGWRRRKYYPAAGRGCFSTWVRTREGKPRLLKVWNLLQTVMERHIKVKAEANPYHPDWVEYFEKRRCFAWRSYPVGNRSPLAGAGV